MIARMWRGVTREADADVYGEYMVETGFGEYGTTPGNRGAWLLRRDDGEQTRFLALSLWESLDAVRGFAGDDVEAAVLYPEDARYLLPGSSSITHYDVVDRVDPA